MNAHANRNKETERDLMSSMASKVAESMLQIMQYFGIQKIESQKYKSADYNQLVTSITLFTDTPKDIAQRGLVIKDAIATILASVGILSMGIDVNEDERKKLITGYESLIDIYKNPNKYAAPKETKKASEDKENKNETPDTKAKEAPACKNKKRG